MEAAEVVLAGGKENIGGAEAVAAIERSDPIVPLGNERFDRRAAHDLTAILFGAREQGRVQNAARERERMKGKTCGDRFACGGKTKILDGYGAEIEWVYANLAQIFDCLAAQELAADLVMRAGFLFEEQGVVASRGKADSGHGACGTASDDEVIDDACPSAARRGVQSVFLRLTQRRAGKTG